MPNKILKQNHGKDHQKYVKDTTIKNGNNETISNKPANITLAGFCAVCWNNALYHCFDCQLIGYCCFSHMASDWMKHKHLCSAVNIVTKNTGSLYGSKINNADDWRYKRIEISENIKILLQRQLKPDERDLLLFPKSCSVCYKTRSNELEECQQCHQIWHCRSKPDHLSKNHSQWCKKLQLFSNLVKKQVEGKLYMYDMNFGSVPKDNLQLKLNDNIEKVIKQIVNTSEELDNCQISMISQAASGPLTILNSLQITKTKIRKSLTLHLIGAEHHYEGNVLQAWETFFMHFLSEISHLKIIMVGPELNSTNNYESLRLCEKCRMKKKSLTFEYKNGLLYHEYAAGKNFINPDLVCAFNPGLHRSTGFNQNDTWPQTISAALSTKCPFIFTAYTSFEAPLDLKRVQENELIRVVQSPKLNPFASLKPDRNFVSDHEAPLIFKNYYFTIVTSAV